MTELTKHGYQNLTFEGVARRVKTSKPVLYRRFTTRLEMMTFAAVRIAPAFLTELQGSTSLRRDFQNLVNVLQRWVEHIGIVTMLGVLSEVSPQQREHFSAVAVYPGFVTATRLYRAAITRGELSEAVLDPFYIRFPMLLLLVDILTRDKVGKAELMKPVDRVIIPRLTTLWLYPAVPHQDNRGQIGRRSPPLMHCNKQEYPEPQEHRHVEGEVEDAVLFHQVLSVEDITLTQFGVEFASEFIERSVPLIASRLDLDRADFCRRSTVIFRASLS